MRGLTKSLNGKQHMPQPDSTKHNSWDLAYQLGDNRADKFQAKYEQLVRLNVPSDGAIFIITTDIDEEIAWTHSLDEYIDNVVLPEYQKNLADVSSTDYATNIAEEDALHRQTTTQVRHLLQNLSSEPAHDMISSLEKTASTIKAYRASLVSNARLSTLRHEYCLACVLEIQMVDQILKISYTPESLVRALVSRCQYNLKRAQAVAESLRLNQNQHIANIVLGANVKTKAIDAYGVDDNVLAGQIKLTLYPSMNHVRITAAMLIAPINCVGVRMVYNAVAGFYPVGRSIHVLEIDSDPLAREWMSSRTITPDGPEVYHLVIITHDDCRPKRKWRDYELAVLAIT
ncbi:hypothetical protein DICA1_F14576 [Diutina catenulata]